MPDDDEGFERICEAGDRAAGLLAVAAHRRRKFIEAILGLVEVAHLRAVENVGARLLTAAKAVRAAHGAIAKLPPEQKERLSLYLRILMGAPLMVAPEGLEGPQPWLRPSLPPNVRDNLVSALIDAMDAAFGDAVGRAPHAPSSKRGKPRGAKSNWVMHDFALTLWLVCESYGDVPVTLSNSGGEAGGTIVALLKILKPALPKQFFPGILNHSFLREVQKVVPTARHRDYARPYA